MTASTLPFTGTFTIDPNHSSFHFEVTHMLVSRFRGSFSDVAGEVAADEHGVRLEGRIPVESISIRTPEQFREHVLNGAEFFHASRHPEITFRSAHVELTPDATFTGTGELTIKGITKPITVTGSYRTPVADLHGVARAAIELDVTVDRRG